MVSTPLVSVAVVDDSSRDRRHIEVLLQRFEEENAVSFQVREYVSGAALLENYQPDFDIIFLDIQMEGIDGMRTAAAIRKIDTRVLLVFVTKTAQYATSGYSVQAQGYLLKPITHFAFHTEMARCLEQLRRHEKASILVGSGVSVRRVDLADIFYLESNRHKITIHMAGEDYAFSGTLKAFEDTLLARNFYRAHSGYLINLQHLIAIDNEEAIMANGDRLKISRSRKKGLMEALTNYIGGRIS